MKKRSPIVVLATEDDDRSTLSGFFSGLGPWGGSAIAHCVFVLVLVLWTIPILQSGTLQLTAFTGVEDGDAEEMSFAVEDLTGADLEVDADSLLPPVEITEIEPIKDLIDVELASLETDVAKELPAEDTPTELISDQTTLAASMAGGAVGEADSVEQAVDQITGGIHGRLDDGDLLVVWLLDSSLSLQDDRQRVAKRLTSFLEETSVERPDGHKLVNAVATFGRSFREVVSPTQKSKPVLNSIKKTPVDLSGKENVFLAVEKCVVKYRKRWNSQMMIVVWTDESGDDFVRLKKTIAGAKQANVAVSVVGPSAVLGSTEALHDWTDPKTGRYQPLPISRGPDSAMPERIRMSYWFRGPPPRGVRERGRRFPVWYGNDDLLGLSSGFSPWALTRLCAETGGSYTLFDRSADRPPFDRELMEAYRPEYLSREDYQDSIRSHPLRKAVMRAVSVSRSENIVTPDLMFFGLRSPNPPHAIQPLYFTPVAFQRKLSSSRGRITRQIQRTSYAVEKALASVSSGGDAEKGMDEEYSEESSPRWKAWYDVTRGRLLAVSVRLEEYRLAMDEIMQRDGLRDDTNGIVCGPSQQMRSNGNYIERADEAERLLMRCVQDHADTPWAYLAERELAHGLGISIQQMAYTPTGNVKKQSGSKLPSF